MSKVKPSWVGLVVCVAACSSKGVPVEAPVSGNSVTVLVPKDVEGVDGPLKGVILPEVDRLTEQKPVIGSYTNNSIKDFYSVNSSVPAPGKLLTRVCQGEQYEDGRRDSSCVSYEARLDVVEKPEGFQLSITPVKMVTQKGRNALGIGLDLPQFQISDWYQHVTDESIKSHYKVTSKFAPEAVKASFDRHFKVHANGEGEANAAMRQFQAEYEQSANGAVAHISAAFSPYQDGTMVECQITMASSGATTLDWGSALSAVQKELDSAATE